MKWSWRLFKVFGIGIYVHVTFFLLLVWAGWTGFAGHHTLRAALVEIGFIITLFVIVVLHELGHALTARRFGIATRDITLLPIGGVARLERMPEDPKQELAVALAGPLVNVVLALFLFAGLALGAHLTSVKLLLEHPGNFFVQLLWVNVLLVLFNLLPAFPMDGGRVLRALLAIRINYVRATNIAAKIGQGMAFCFGLAGLFGNPFLVLVALFVWTGAAQEAGMVQMKFALGATRVGHVMITDFKTLAPEETLSRAVEFLLAGYQQDFPVVADGRMVGLLTRAALVNGLARLGAEMPVADAMEQQFTTANPLEPVEKVFQRLQTASSRSMPVIENGQLVGILTSENIGEFLMVQSALHPESGTRETAARLTAEHQAT